MVPLDRPPPSPSGTETRSTEAKVLLVPLRGVLGEEPFSLEVLLIKLGHLARASNGRTASNGP